MKKEVIEKYVGSIADPFEETVTTALKEAIKIDKEYMISSIEISPVSVDVIMKVSCMKRKVE